MFLGLLLKAMDKLMLELENFILQEENYEENYEEESCYSDWDLITRFKKGTDKTNNCILKLLDNLKLDHKVYKTSLEFYNKTLENNNFKRLKFKNALMCSCVFLAFSYHNDHREEKSLMKYFNIDKQKYTKGLKMVKTSIEEVRQIINSFDNLLFSISREMNIVDDIPHMKHFVDSYKEFAMLKTKRISSNTVCCALTYIWLCMNKQKIPTLNSYAKTCNISEKSLYYVIIKNKNLLDKFLLNNISNVIFNFIIIFKKKSYFDIKNFISPLDNVFILKIFYKNIKS